MTRVSLAAPNSMTAWLVGMIIIVGTAAQASRILSTRSSTGETPFHSANDRSRWCTVASLVEKGTYEIDAWLAIRDPQTRRATWNTIDLVRHRGSDGKQHYYSSKPPLLTTMYAGVYAVVRWLTGTNLTHRTFYAARLILILVNLVPLVCFWWLWARWIRRTVSDEWSQVVLMSFLVWGTFLSTFANTMNNHLPAALAAGVSLWAVDRILLQRDGRLQWFVLAGLATAFTAANELPALSWVAAIGALLCLHDWRRTLCGYVAGLLPIAIAFAVTTYIAHGSLRPPYAHRGLGPLVTSLPIEQSGSHGQYKPNAISAHLKSAGIDLSSKLEFRPSRTPGVIALWDEVQQYQFALVENESILNIHHWDDWYDYPKSYWYPDQVKGVDRGERWQLAYAFHALLGHHGVFSLTPFWILSILGCVVVWSQRRLAHDKLGFMADRRLQIMLAIAAVTTVCLVFYIMRPLQDRNYGGVSSGFRWMFWFTPLWLWLAMQGIQAIKSEWQRFLVALAVSISVFSAMYPWANPWTNPWLMQYMEYLQIVRY